MVSHDTVSSNGTMGTYHDLWRSVQLYLRLASPLLRPWLGACSCTLCTSYDERGPRLGARGLKRIFWQNLPGFVLDHDDHEPHYASARVPYTAPQLAFCENYLKLDIYTKPCFATTGLAIFKFGNVCHNTRDCTVSVCFKAAKRIFEAVERGFRSGQRRYLELAKRCTIVRLGTQAGEKTVDRLSAHRAAHGFP